MLVMELELLCIFFGKLNHYLIWFRIRREISERDALLS